MKKYSLLVCCPSNHLARVFHMEKPDDALRELKGCEFKAFGKTCRAKKLTLEKAISEAREMIVFFEHDDYWGYVEPILHLCDDKQVIENIKDVIGE